MLHFVISIIISITFQVDLHYPVYLFNEHRDQPLAPELIDITMDMLDNTSQAFLKKEGFTSYNQKRLAPNFYDKKEYVCHIANLKFYLKQGLILEKIHRVVTFHQSNWLEPYIKLNTEKRIVATSDFEKGFFKLLVR